MEWIHFLWEFVMHLDKHLDVFVRDYGMYVYIILFLIIFIETGVVVMPFLPGDSLLFAVGALCATNTLNLPLALVLLFVAAVLGDTLNYGIGNYIGPKVFQRDYKYLKKSHLLKTQAFYEKHGGKAIIIARFIPIVRTFAPFVAGVGTMRYAKFLAYNVIGGAIWVTFFILVGFFFGNLPFVKENFGLVTLAIIALSLVPPLIEYIKHRSKTKEIKA
jgi:membrane-associated protein